MSIDHLLLASLAAALGLWGVLLLTWHRAADEFDLRWSVVDATTGKVSLFKLGQLAALIVSTWGFVVLIERDKMTEFYFVGYMLAWSGANILNKWVERKAGAQ